MNALVQACRARLGTPFRHRGRTARGLDCAGLARVAYEDCGLDLPDFLRYGREPHEDGLIAHVTQAMGAPVALAPVHAALLQPGDVVVMRFSIEPHHVGIVGDYLLGGLSLIHACGHTGRVIEHRLARDQIRRITHVFRRPI